MHELFRGISLRLPTARAPPSRRESRVCLLRARGSGAYLEQQDVDPEALRWPRRATQIKKVLHCLAPTIVCLQEVPLLHSAWVVDVPHHLSGWSAGRARPSIGGFGLAAWINLGSLPLRPHQMLQSNRAKVRLCGCVGRLHRSMTTSSTHLSPIDGKLVLFVLLLD